jgi:hydroxypyruvate reductase
MGYHALVLSSMIEGDTAQAARFHAAIAREAEESGNPLKLPACIISGGETTVVVRGDGLGGRNTEFALEWAAAMEGSRQASLLCAGTYGTDGPTDAAGALADGGTIGRGRAAGMQHSDYLARNDTYTYFKKTGDLLVTGPSGTNVMDVRIMLIVCH